MTNRGLISGASIGVLNSGTIAAINNNGGTITGTGVALSGGAGSSIGTLTNTGRITGTTAGISLGTGANITSLFNNVSGTLTGTISGQTAILSSGATIGTLTNVGLISGSSFALKGVFGVIANNGGLIAGNIQGTSGSPLTITGGSGSTFGTLTGSGGGIGSGNIGTLTNTSSNLVFSSGNLLLNNHINVGSNTAVNSGGTLQVNNSITITGNYTQNAGGTLNIGVANGAVSTGVISADSGYGRLVITGVATFDAGSSVALKKLSTYNFALGQKFVVAQANNGSANYNVGSLNYSAEGYSDSMYGSSVTDSDDSTKTVLLVTLGTSAPTNSATTTNAASALSGLFNYGGTNANMLTMFNAAAALGSTAEANRAGAQLSPAATTAAAIQSAQAPTQAVLDVVSSRMNLWRTAPVAGSGVLTGEQGSNVASWGQAFGGRAHQADRSDTSGYRADYSGLLVGADTELNHQWRIGGLINHAATSVDNTGNNTGSSADIKSYGLLGYGGYTAERWYLNLSGGVVQQQYRTQRSVSYTGFSGNATGKLEGWQYIASALAGYPVKLDDTTTLTPITGLTYSYLRQNAYTETGSVAALHVNATNTNSLKSSLGAKLERSLKTSYGEITPQAQLIWRHEFCDTDVQTVANFAADGNGATSFTTRGSTGAADTGVLVLGATLARSQNLSLAAHYTLEAASGYSSHTADLRLRYQF
ncbi:MAG: autotransporter domain-containing protein [Rhodocyclaceae bacterium]